MVAQGARQAGMHVIGVGIRGLTDPALTQFTNDFYWTGILRLGQWIRIFQKHQCGSVIMAGSVQKTDLYGRIRVLDLRPDWTSLGLFFKVGDYRSDTILSALADEFTKHGIVVENCVKFTQQAMAPEGYMTMAQLTAAQQKDAEFGWTVAKELGRFDIGQAVAVKEQDVIAVEAIEGTDRMIERAGQLCTSGGWCLVKVSKPHQDMRFDVPTVGPATISKMHAYGGKVLCLEAGKTMVVDPEELIIRAERCGIVVLGRRG